MVHGEHVKQSGFNWYKVGRWGAIGIIGYFLITEHRAHMIQFLPFALLLACPFMHMFMHHGNHEENEKKEWK